MASTVFVPGSALNALPVHGSIKGLPSLPRPSASTWVTSSCDGGGLQSCCKGRARDRSEGAGIRVDRVSRHSARKVVHRRALICCEDEPARRIDRRSDGNRSRDKGGTRNRSQRASDCVNGVAGHAAGWIAWV